MMMGKKRKLTDATPPGHHCCQSTCPLPTPSCSKHILEPGAPSKKYFPKMKDGIENNLSVSKPLHWSSKEGSKKSSKTTFSQLLTKNTSEPGGAENSVRKSAFLTGVKICTSISAVLKPPVLTLSDMIARKTPLFLRKAPQVETKLDEILDNIKQKEDEEETLELECLNEFHTDKSSFPDMESEALAKKSKHATECKDNWELSFLKPLFFEVSGGRGPFIGREWLFEIVEEALESSRVIGVIGNVGTGKTAFVLQIVENSCFGHPAIPGQRSDMSKTSLKFLAQKLVAFHFCQVEVHPTCLVPEFVHSLAAQLSQAPQLSAYKEFLTSQSPDAQCLSMAHCLENPSKALVRGILLPLSGIYGPHKIRNGHYFIIIDSLDSAETETTETTDHISAFVSAHLNYFPSWLKMIVTVGTDHEELISALSPYKLRLDEWESEWSQDIIAYIHFRSHHSIPLARLLNKLTDYGRFQNYLLKLSGGSFLYVKILLDLMESGALSSYSLETLPTELSALFSIYTAHRFSVPGSFEAVTPILSTCLAARSPLTLLEIYHSVNSLGATMRITWESFVDQFELLAETLPLRSDGTYTFQSAYRNWLTQRSEGQGTRFLVDPRIGHTAISLRLLRVEGSLSPEKILDLGHHLLKAKVFRKGEIEFSGHDLEVISLIQTGVDLSAALTSVRNIFRPNVKVSRLFLSAGADPNKETEFYDGAPLLIPYVALGNYTMTSLLLDFSADVNGTNLNEETPLHFATTTGNEDIAKLLLQRGASLDYVDWNGFKCLDKAIQAGHVPIVRLLLKRGAKLSPLTWELVEGKAEIALILLNKILTDGNTLLKGMRLREAVRRYEYGLQKLRTPKYSQGIDRSKYKRLEVTFLLQLSRCERKTQGLETAKLYVDEAIQVEPESGKAYMARAKIHQSLKRTTMALADVQQALDLSSSHPHSMESEKQLFRLREELSRELKYTSQDLLNLKKSFSPRSHLERRKV